MTKVIIYRAHEHDDGPLPLLTALDSARVVTVYNPPHLLSVWLQRAKILFTDQSKRRSAAYYAMAKLLGLRYGRTMEARALFHAQPQPNSLLLVANDYAAADIYASHLRGLHRPLAVYCLHRGRRRLLYIQWIWLLTLLWAPAGGGRQRPDLTILYINAYAHHVPDILCRLFPQAQLILRYHDPMDRYFAGIKRLAAAYRDRRVRFESYSRHDALELNIHYQPNFVDAQLVHNLDAAAGTSPRVVFIGTAGPARRLQTLLQLAWILESAGVDYAFWVNDHSLQIQALRQCTALPSHLYVNQQQFSYSEYLHIVAGSTCLIDLWRVTEHEGYSYRISEAVIMGKKLLTNRAALLKEPFYTPHNIFMLGGTAQPGLAAQLVSFLCSPAIAYKNTACLTLSAWSRRYKLSDVPPSYAMSTAQ